VRLGNRNSSSRRSPEQSWNCRRPRKSSWLPKKAFEALTDDLPQSQTQALETVKNARQVLNDARRRYDR
jgi:hypothetical protein